MEPGHFHLQTVISVVMILGASVVAFICDFLKRNNEQLRELNVELKVRHEEERWRAEALTPQSSPSVAPPSAEKPVPENRPNPPASRTSRSVAAPSERKRTLAPDAWAAMERGARLAGEGPRPKTRSVVVTPKAAVAPAPAIVKQVPRKRDWNTLLARRHAGPPAGIPAGYHEGYVLSQLVQSRQPVTGLVVSIGVSAPRETDGSLPETVRKLIQSLIGAEDFACQSGEEEFLLLYPQLSGAAAQHRLTQVAQQLWDFQLGLMGTSSILFAWGGLEVRSESIDEAIASANDRMLETKRGRRLPPMEVRTAPPLFKQAV